MVDEESGRLFHSGLKGLEGLDDATRLIFVQRVTAIFIVWFNGYLQHQRNLIPEDFWNTFAGDIASYFQHPGIWRVLTSVRPGQSEQRSKNMKKLPLATLIVWIGLAANTTMADINFFMGESASRWDVFSLKMELYLRDKKLSWEDKRGYVGAGLNVLPNEELWITLQPSPKSNKDMKAACTELIASVRVDNFVDVKTGEQFIDANPKFLDFFQQHGMKNDRIKRQADAMKNNFYVLCGDLLNSKSYKARLFGAGLFQVDYFEEMKKAYQ